MWEYLFADIITAKFTVHLQRYLQGLWHKASLLLAAQTGTGKVTN